MKKRKLILTSLSILAIVGISMIVNNNIEDKSDLSNGLSHANIIVDSSNLEKFSGLVDYVFIGKVTNTIGTYFDEELPEIPYTKYEIEVIENLKGNLIDKIEVSKNGGYNKDGNLIKFDEHGLPENNQIYIFYAFAQEDGSILLSSVDGNMKIDFDNSKAKSNKDKSLLKYMTAIENAEEYKRERFVSKYEK